MAKLAATVLMLDSSTQVGVLVQRPVWNPDRERLVGFVKIGDREVAVEPIRDDDGICGYRQLGAQLIPGSRIGGQ